MKKTLILLLVFSNFAFTQTRPRPIEWFDYQFKFAENLVKANNRTDLRPVMQSLHRQRDQAVHLYRQGQTRRADRVIRNATLKLWGVIRPMISVPLEIAHRKALLNLIKADSRTESNDRNTRQMLNQARAAYQEGLDSIIQNHPAKALTSFKQSMDFSQKALRTTERSGQKNSVQELRMLYSRAERVVRDCDDDRAKKLFIQLQNLRSSIESAQKRGNHRLVISLSKTATRLALRIIDMCEGNNLSSQDQIYADLDLLAEILDIAADHLDNLPNRTAAHKAYERARSLFEQAEQAALDKNFHLAEDLLQQARALVARVLSDTKPSNLSQRATEQIDRLDRQLSNLSRAEISKPEFLDRVLNFKNQAEQSIATQKLHLALEYILAANRLLEKARDPNTLTPQTSAAGIHADLAKLENRLLNPDEQQDSVQTDLNDAALQVIQWGYQALEKNHLSLAFELEIIARNIAIEQD